MIRTGLIWSAVAFALSVALSFYGQIVIPDGTQIAVHWGPSGEVDRYAGKSFGLWLVPVIQILTVAFFILIPFVEPRRRHLLQSNALYITAWIGVVVVFTTAHGFIVAIALGYDLPVSRVIGPMIGLLLAAVGNVMGKSQSNFFVGFRTPWTLSSDEAWDRTHRLAGWLWVIGGLSIAVMAFLFKTELAAWMIIGIIATIAAIPPIASYFFWRKASDRQVNGEA